MDANEVDMIIGSLSGPLCAAGGFCAGTEEVVEHQRISSASYTYSAALPALLSTTASETIAMLQEQPEILTNLRENVKAMRAQLDPRSDWVRCLSSVENPIMLLTFKPEVVASKNLSYEDQNQIFRDVVDEVCFVPISLHALSGANAKVTVSREQRPRHQAQGLPRSKWREPTRTDMAADAGLEGLRYVWLDEEGD